MEVKDILLDPDFHALPEIERLKVLWHVDPDYRQLHPRERWKVARYAHLIPTPPPSYATVPPTEELQFTQEANEASG